MPAPDVQRIYELPPPPARPREAHKGTFGSALVIAGSEGMSGAACLAGQAALHGGAGLVTVATPRSVAGIVASAHPSYMTAALADDDAGRVSTSAIPVIEQALTRQTAVAIGPGLGQSREVTQVVHHLHEACSLPIVLDADALNAFAGSADKVLEHPSQAARVLTPHPGEFSRLTGLDTATIQANRDTCAVEFALNHKVVVLLKGANTVITDGNRLATNITGGPALATGGSGDLLTGLIVSLIAQGMTAFDAAHLGAHLHGLAGDVAAERFGERFVTSLEILRCLAEAWTALEAAKS